jgi:hypothetical protein
MKTSRMIALCILSAAALGLFVGCMLLPVSIETRISNFEAALNGDRTQAYKNLDPSSPEYDANNGWSGLWDAHFPLSSGSDTTPFVITLDVYSDPLDVKATVTGPDLYNKRVQFVMVNIGVGTEDWRIQDILKETSPGSGIYQSIFV